VGTFGNVSMGLGALTVNSVDVGYLKGKVNYKYAYEIEKFETGVPLKLQGQITKKLSASLTATLAELSAENMAMALGGLSISTVTAVEVTIADGDNQERTFASIGGAGLECIQLGPGTPATLFNTLVVENSAENTTYTAGTDYLLDPTSGKVWRNPAGSITSGQTVRVSYKYTPTAGKQINLGVTFSLSQVPLTFVHTKPNTNKDITVVMHKCSANGTVDINFDEQNFILNDVTFDAIEDTTNAAHPFGYIYEET